MMCSAGLLFTEVQNWLLKILWKMKLRNNLIIQSFGNMAIGAKKTSSSDGSYESRPSKNENIINFDRFKQMEPSRRARAVQFRVKRWLINLENSFTVITYISLFWEYLTKFQFSPLRIFSICILKVYLFEYVNHKCRLLFMSVWQ